jgi:uncharacterized protein YunC (DUF1805 family)
MKNVAEFRGRAGAVAAQQNASYVVRVWRAMQRISSMSSGAIGMVVSAAGAIGVEDGAAASSALVGA